MKLVRYGPAGKEKPGLIDTDGKLRDLSRKVKDIDGVALAPALLVRAPGHADTCLVTGHHTFPKRQAGDGSHLALTRGRACPGVGHVRALGLHLDGRRDDRSQVSGAETLDVGQLLAREGGGARAQRLAGLSTIRGKGGARRRLRDGQGQRQAHGERRQDRPIPSHGAR